MQTTVEPRLLHYPAISGDTVIFTYAGDLWASNTAPGSIARRLTSSPGPEVAPKVSPDGKTIAFSAAYDGALNVYMMPIEGGEPVRLTFDANQDLVAGWTPDGRIAYTSSGGNYTNRDQRLWFVSPKGGLPTTLPLVEVDQVSFLGSADNLVYQRSGSERFNWRRYRGGTQGRISFYNVTTNTYSELPSKREQSYYPMAVGDSVLYISDKQEGTLNLFRYDLKSKKDVQLTHYADADIKRPSTDGKSVVFERDGYLVKYDIATGKEAKLSPRILSDNLRTRPSIRNLARNISDLSINPSGTRVAVEARGDIFSVPTGEGDTKLIAGGTGRERFPTYSPDGKTIAYMSDESGEYEVYTRSAKGGEGTKLTTGAPKSPTSITYSPDGKLIAITCRGGEIGLYDSVTKTLKSIQTNLPQTRALSFSADSKYIAYLSMAPNQQSKVSVYEIQSGVVKDVTDGFYSESDVTFDQNGKYLYIISQRTFNQNGTPEGALDLNVSGGSRVYVIPLKKDTANPLIKAVDEDSSDEVKKPEEKKPEEKKPEEKKPEDKKAEEKKSDDKKPEEKKPVVPSIDFDGIAERVIPLPWEAGQYSGLVSAKDGVFVFTPSGLKKFDLNTQSSVQISGPVPPVLISFNETRTKLGYVMAGRVAVVEVRPGLQFAPGSVDVSGVEGVIDPKAEWKQIFWEAWRWERDNYYDPNMRGLDWKAIGDRYAKYLEFASSRGDLNEIIGLMIGELGTGHSYVGGGDAGVGATGVSVGMLGADYVSNNGKIQFKKIYKGRSFDESETGPLGDPTLNLKDGDYLLSVDGKSLDGNTAPGSLLLNKVGRTVVLKVNSKPTEEGARIVRVKPIADETEVRYAEWVEQRRKLVDQLSGGKIGYMHVPNTSEEGASGFARAFYGVLDKQALIVDERNNGGGNLPWYFTERLARMSQTMLQPRHGVDSPDRPAFEGPKAMLINQNAGSGGDMFPYLFRKTNLGPLVGKRTWGGLVGIGGSAPLVDGGFLTAPEFSIYDPETNEIVAENQGIDPDVDIDNRPDLVALGRDPQIEKAVEILLEQIKKMPKKKTRTGIPSVGKNGKIENK